MGTAGATNSAVTIGTGTGFSANVNTNKEYDIKVGPSLTALATLMTGATSGLIKKTAADTYALDTTNYYHSGNLTSLKNPNALTITAPLSGTSYDGSSAVTINLADGYGDTKNPYASKTAKYFLAAPNAAAGVPDFRAILASDIPTLNQNTTGSAGSLTKSLTIKSGGGTVEGTSMYTFNGAADKSINLVGGTNITIDNTAGTLTFNTPTPATPTLQTVTAAGATSDKALTLSNATPLTLSAAASSIQFGNTATRTANLFTDATVNAATKTINIGTGGVSGSTTEINMGTQ